MHPGFWMAAPIPAEPHTCKGVFFSRVKLLLQLLSTTNPKRNEREGVFWCPCPHTRLIELLLRLTASWPRGHWKTSGRTTEDKEVKLSTAPGTVQEPHSSGLLPLSLTQFPPPATDRMEPLTPSQPPKPPPTLDTFCIKLSMNTPEAVNK
jgi:hypothetical protein